MSIIKTVEDAYTEFLLKFTTACRGYSLSPTCPIFKCSQKNENTDCFYMSFKSPLHLIEWPYKQVSKKSKKVDILIDALERISLDDPTIVKSNVHISYFEVKNSKREPIESIHYDFEESIQMGHPFFHAQLCCDLVDGSKSETFKKYDVGNDGIKKRFQHLRIPTAHMNLISVLISLVADHMNSNILKELIEDTKKVKNLPNANSEKLFDNIKRYGKDFRSLHWYQSP